MTKEEILKIEAGPELDKLVAEKVLKRVVKSWETFRGKPIYQMQIPSAYGEVWEHLPPYSTDISAAWPVVEKLRLAVFSIYLDGDWKWACCKDYALDSVANEMQWLGELTICDTTPEAICKAALPD